MNIADLQNYLSGLIDYFHGEDFKAGSKLKRMQMKREKLIAEINNVSRMIDVTRMGGEVVGYSLKPTKLVMSKF